MDRRGDRDRDRYLDLERRGEYGDGERVRDRPREGDLYGILHGWAGC